ncbi:MAG: glycine cleavage system aminomethyltransferase GcvT [Frankiaceae bacterium]
MQRSPLHARHVAAGARLVGFGGWQMPLQFTGVVEEHLAVRTTAGLFDVSHLGKVRVRGAGAAGFVNACLTNDLARIGPGRAQYTLCCTEDGGVVDDLIAYLRSGDEVFLVPNAANAGQVAGRLQAVAPPGLTVADEHHDHAILAVQGPRSPDVLAAAGLPSGFAYMSFVDATWRGRPVTVCRSGYTGEHGYEVLPGWADAEPMWDALLAAGASAGLVACGLGARDTLRTEMGYPLHGQDLSESVTPVQAGLGWAVGWDKERFWGRERLRAEKAAGPARRLWGLRARDRAVPRPHMDVRTSDAGDAGGTGVGEVTSGTFSPTLRAGIGLALLAATVGHDEEVTVDVRGRPAAMTVVRPPFVPRSPR